MEKVIVKINDSELEKKIAELREWKATLEEVVDEVDKITTDIKGIMNDIGETKVECGGMKISATEVTMKKIELAGDSNPSKLEITYVICGKILQMKMLS